MSGSVSSEPGDGPSPSDAAEEVPAPLPWDAVLQVLSRLSHNVRNHLNTASLEATFAREVSTEAEVRQSLGQIGESLNRIKEEFETLRHRLEPGVASVPLTLPP